MRIAAREAAEHILHFARTPPPNFAANIEIAATFHDLGKLDPDNQYALNKGRAGRMPWDHIDAGVAHLVAKGNQMAAWLVRSHHAPGLPCLTRQYEPDVGLKLRGRRRDSAERSEHIKQIERTNAKLMQYLADHEAAIGTDVVDQANTPHGLALRLALSCLVDADHSDTAAFDSGASCDEPAPANWQDRLKALDAYVDALGSQGKGHRDSSRTDFYHLARNSTLSDYFACCEAPVGLGKTTAITAFLLHTALQRNLRRLFIVAPYTSIIDQTVAVLRTALSLPGEDPQKVVVAHHHKADFSSRLDRDLAVLWRAPIVVTTSVQFFETLAECAPSSLRKLHELPGSAIFLDEAHAALPASLWPQNWRWLHQLAEQWNCRFVLASGSLARFWENRQVIDPPTVVPEIMSKNFGDDAFQLEKSRIQYRTVGLFTSPDDLINFITQKAGPRLLILNTVQSAAVVAQRMRELGKDVLHVSTALCPRDRAYTVEQISRRLKGHITDWTVVATSCLETGLNLSFRTGFRERFSTSSLIQTGGRVNRNSEHNDHGSATVYDFVIDPVNGITSHPGARIPGEVLKRQLARGEFENSSAATLVTAAMAEELKSEHTTNRLSKAENQKDYPMTAKHGRLISAPTRLVVVDDSIVASLKTTSHVSFQKILTGSVQIWANKIELLNLSQIPGKRDLYEWPHDYNGFIGYMAGVLKTQHFLNNGGEVI